MRNGRIMIRSNVEIAAIVCPDCGTIINLQESSVSQQLPSVMKSGAGAVKTAGAPVQVSDSQPAIGAGQPVTPVVPARQRALVRGGISCSNCSNVFNTNMMMKING